MMGIIGDAGICVFNKGHLSTKNCRDSKDFVGSMLSD